MVICQSSNRKLIHLHSNQSLNIKNKRDYAISNIFFSVWFGNLIAILLILVPHASGTSTSAYYSLSDYPATIFIINILFWHYFSSPVSYLILFLVYSNIFSKFLLLILSEWNHLQKPLGCSHFLFSLCYSSSMYFYASVLFGCGCLLICQHQMLLVLNSELKVPYKVQSFI